MDCFESKTEEKEFSFPVSFNRYSVQILPTEYLGNSDGKLCVTIILSLINKNVIKMKPREQNTIIYPNLLPGHLHMKSSIFLFLLCHLFQKNNAKMICKIIT